MTPIRRKTFLTLAASYAVARPAAAEDDAEWQKVVAAAKKEGRITLYTASIGSPFQKEVLQRFEKTYGIRVEAFEARASEVRERVRIEQAAGRFAGDVHYNGQTATWLMERDGNFQPHGPIPNLKNIDSIYTVDGTRVPCEINSYGLLANRNLVKPADEPKSWLDLLDPKWKGKLLSDDMRALGGGSVFFVVMHDTFGKQFHEKYATQKPVLARDLAGSERRTARGEFPLYVPFLLSDYNQIRGLPVKPIVPAEGRPYVLFNLTVLKNAPHPNAARLFINFYLEPEQQLVFANAGFNPAVKGVVEKVPEDMRALIATKLMGTTVPPRQDEMMALAKEIYQ